MTAEVHKKPRLSKWLALLLAIALSIAIIWLTARYQQQIVSWGETGLLGLFVVSILGNATLIIPVPGYALSCAAGLIYQPVIVGVVSAAGAALGELTGYLAGYGGQALLPQGRFYRWLHGFMQRHGLLAIFLLGAIPNPVFDVGGLLAGVIRLPVWKFLLAAWAGKTVRLTLMALACQSGLPWLEQLAQPR